MSTGTIDNSILLFQDGSTKISLEETSDFWGSTEVNLQGCTYRVTNESYDRARTSLENLASEPQALHFNFTADSRGKELEALVQKVNKFFESAKNVITFTNINDIETHGSTRNFEEKTQATQPRSLIGGRSTSPPAPRAEQVFKRDYGLENLGTTCWFNSVTQAFFRRTGSVLREALQERANSQEPCYEIESKRANKYLELIDSEKAPTSKQLEEFIKPLCSVSKFNINHQQDACEGLNKLTEYFKLDKTQAYKNAQITTNTQIGEFKPTSYNSSMIILENTNTDSIQKALVEQFHTKNTTDIEFRPDGHSEIGSFKKKTFLSTPIKMKNGIFQLQGLKEFTIQAPRFSFDGTKNDKAINFEDNLTIPICGDFGKKQINGVLRLKLKTVVTHMGSSKGGHYVSYYRNKEGLESNEAILANDSKVTIVDYAAHKSNIEKNSYLATYEVVGFTPGTRS